MHEFTSQNLHTHSQLHALHISIERLDVIAERSSAEFLPLSKFQINTQTHARITHHLNAHGFLMNTKLNFVEYSTKHISAFQFQQNFCSYSRRLNSIFTFVFVEFKPISINDFRARVRCIDVAHTRAWGRHAFSFVFVFVQPKFQHPTLSFRSSDRGKKLQQNITFNAMPI